MLSHHSPDRIPEAATVAAPAQAPATAGAETPPPYPTNVTNPPPVTVLTGGGKTLTCQEQVGSFWVDAPQSAPTTPADLYRVSSVVVIATATKPMGYWQKDDGHLPAPNLTHLDWAPLTVTNFKVERVLKGSAGSWLQIVDMGADPNSIATCPKRAVVAKGWPEPVEGQRYVLFLQFDSSRGINRDELGPMDRFTVTGGTVHSDWMPGFQNTPLDQFLRSLTA